MAVLALLLASCTREDPHAAETTRKLTNLELTLAQQQHDLAALTAAQADVTAKLQTILDQIDALGQRIAKLETGKLAMGAPRPARREPDRAVTYSVPIAGDPMLGPADAKVTLVMAMDFACPYCRKAWDTVDQLRVRYGADLRVVYKPFIVHTQTATHAAYAGCAAQHQGKFRELADLLWTKSFDVRDFADTTIDALAAEAKLDVTRYNRDVAGSCAQEVKDDMAVLTKLGVGATPSFFINGRYMSGAMPIENFASLVDEELAKTSDAQKRGVKPAQYYQQEIVAKGVKELPPAAPATP
jgi:protein-disulfide isomerase